MAAGAQKPQSFASSRLFFLFPFPLAPALRF
jgi:hypothetical protein